MPGKEDPRKAADEYFANRRKQHEREAIPDEWRVLLRQKGYSDAAIEESLGAANKMLSREKGRRLAEEKAQKAAKALEKYGEHLTTEDIKNLADSYEVRIQGEQDWTDDE